VSVLESELIGLMPRKAVEMTAAGFLRLPGFDGKRVIESQLEAKKAT
jgi:glutamate formiminotransferase